MEKANKVEYVSVRLGSQDSFEKHCKGRNGEQSKTIDL